MKYTYIIISKHVLKCSLRIESNAHFLESWQNLSVVQFWYGAFQTLTNGINLCRNFLVHFINFLFEIVPHPPWKCGTTHSLQIYFSSFKWMLVNKRWVDLQAISNKKGPYNIEWTAPPPQKYWASSCFYACIHLTTQIQKSGPQKLEWDTKFLNNWQCIILGLMFGYFQNIKFCIEPKEK